MATETAFSSQAAIDITSIAMASASSFFCASDRPGWSLTIIWGMLSSFNPAHAGRALILRSLLRNNDVHFMPRELAARHALHHKRPALCTVLTRSPRDVGIDDRVSLQAREGKAPDPGVSCASRPPPSARPPGPPRETPAFVRTRGAIP